jgi:hypothetical protein
MASIRGTTSGGRAGARGVTSRRLMPPLPGQGPPGWGAG